MKFRAHDTFFIRKGWLSKGVRNVLLAPDVFISRENKPMDVLGIGANMVKALRYWLVAVGLTLENQKGKRIQEITDFGKILYENDPHFEEIGTLWLLHYHLVKDIEAGDTEATAWWYFFNEFQSTEFTKDDFVNQLNKFLRNVGEDERPTRSLEDDFNCIINTYIPRQKMNPEKVKPESNIDCPLGELGLVDFANRKMKVYKKNSPRKDSLHPLIALAVIVYKAKELKEVRISTLQSENGNIGKAFNLDVISLASILNRIELLGYIKVIRTAGLDVIQITTDLDFGQCIQVYYDAISS